MADIYGTPAYLNNEDDETQQEEYGVQFVKSDNALASRGAKLSSLKAVEPVIDDNEPEGQLTIDVYQTPDEIVIESAVAAVAPEDLDINVSGDSVTIRGSRRREREVRDEDYLYQECYWGRFSRSIILPQEVDADGAIATIRNGILKIRLPKLRRERAKKLKVKLE